MDEVMIVTGLVGALVASSYKWGYFVFATVALFFIAYNVTWVGRKYAISRGANVSRTYQICGAWTIGLWFIYPIAWGLCEGGNVIAPDSEAIFYSVLDVLAKPVFGAILLWGHRNIDAETLNVHIRDYDDPKEVNNGVNNGINNDTNNGAANNAASDGRATNRSSRESANPGVTNESLSGAHNNQSAV
jgi:bacteriorhodopsin